MENKWIGTGPSVRARARLAMLVAFFVAVPTLFIGVKRSEDVSLYSNSLVEYDEFWESVSAAHLAVERTRSALWRVEAEPEIENQRSLRATVEVMRLDVQQMIRARPHSFDENSMSLLEKLTLRVVDTVEIGLGAQSEDAANRSRSLSLAQLGISSILRDIKNLESEIANEVYGRRTDAIEAMSKVGRDQTVLLLILLFSIPVFLTFVPAWLVAPLVRLKHIEHRIEEGRVRELAIAGSDEVAQLARAIKDALMWREELDARKSTKIFEIRNVLRAVIAKVNEPVMIIDRTGRINYANQPASDLVNVETHYLEGTGLSDHLISSELMDAFAAALGGDIPQQGIRTRLEFKDGRIADVTARFRPVHDRAGSVSRVVIVLVPH